MKRLILATVIVLLLSGLAIAVWVLQSFSLSPDTSVDHYPRVLRTLRSDGWPYIAHFPSSIPAAATGIHFFFQRSWGQGATELELRFNLPSDQVDAIEREVSPQAIAAPSPSASWPMMRPIAPGFHTLVLGAAATSNGNKGQSHGVAINKATSEIIYWAEEW
jgi:hypothetical protein